MSSTDSLLSSPFHIPTDYWFCGYSSISLYIGVVLNQISLLHLYYNFVQKLIPVDKG